MKNNKTLSNYRIQEAADFIGVSSKTLRRWEAKGKLVPERSVGNQRYYSKELLDGFINKNKLFDPLTQNDGVIATASFKRGGKQSLFLGLLRRPAVAGLLAMTMGAMVLLGGELGLPRGVHKFTPEESIRLPSGENLADSSEVSDGSNVLAAQTGLSGEVGQKYTFTVAIPAQFNEGVVFKKAITAPNIVTSVNDETGEVDLVLTAGSGITVDGLTVTNADKGSSVNVFKTLSVSGQSDVVADGNTDTLTFAGSGITITTDASNDKVTFTSTTPDYSLSGLTDGGTSVYLTTSTDSLGLGISTASYKLHVVGTGYFSDTLTLGGALSVQGNATFGNATSDSITFTGRMANGTSLLPDTDLGSDLGSSALRFNNLWVANINSNSSQSFSGQTTFSYAPTDTTITQASVIINPTTAAANGQLLAFAVAGYERALIDEDGDIILGYSDATSAPATAYPLTVYGHNGTNTLYVDATGNIVTSGSLDINGTTSDVAGALNLSGNSLTSSGALTITPASGNNLNISLATTGDFTVNTNDLVVDTSLGYIGINTTAPTALLDLAGTSGVDAFRLTNSGTKVLGLSYGTNATTFDVASTDPTNKLLNSTFDSDLTSWSEVPSYTLNDQFTTDRAAGAVNGTSAEPTGGTRTVVDTESKLSISSSQLSFAGGKTSPAWGNPGISYPAVTRGAGKLWTGIINFSDSTKVFKWGFHNSATPGQPSAHSFYWNDGGFYLVDNDGNNNLLGGLSTGTNYNYAIVLRSTGAYYYFKGGTQYPNWTLINISSANSTTTLYPVFGNYTGVFTTDNIRIPTSTWLPTPLSYDTFTRADGAISSSETTGPDAQTTPSLAWTGGAISTNKNVITPSLGSELWDADASVFTSGTYAWVAGGTNTIANVGNALQMTYVNTEYGAYNYLRNANDLSSDLTVGAWYQFSGDVSVNTGTAGISVYAGYDINSQLVGSTPTNIPISFRATSATTNYASGKSLEAGEVLTIDNLSLKPLTLSSLFSSVSTSDADVIADANVTLTAGTQAGIVTNLDSTSSPANFLIAYHDGTNVKLDKNVGGTYTNLISAAATYSAGATLRVITYTSSGSLKVRVYYNNALVGTEQTVSDAGIISNTKHGLFSTYSGNSFDNFTLFARGTGAEYTSAPFEELVATRNTTTKYNNSTASVQLVTSGTDANYLQSVNVGDTSTYNLIAYAYTDGSAVTSSDLSLYYDTAVLTTTYTAMGGTGWYKLTGSLTGVASAKDYGVRVKASKTVYVDEMHLQVGTGTAQTMYVLNSNTGVTGLNVQGLINGTLNGVASFSKAGTISDSDFVTATDGLFGFDTTNHRLYFREGGAWSYIARTAGFQVPFDEAQGLSPGDILIPYADEYMSDGAIHGLYKKFDGTSLPSLAVTGNTTLGDTLITGSLLIDNIDSTQTLKLQSLALGSIELVGGNIKFTKEGLIYGNDLIRGRAIITQGQTEVRVDKSWSESPTAITVTPEYQTSTWVENISNTGFTIHTASSPEATESGIFWEAMW